MKFRKKEKDREKETLSLTAEEIYLRNLPQFNLFYLQLVIGAALVLCIAIVLAIYSSMFIGIVTALAVGVIYAYFTGDELKKRLGLTYRSENGGMTVTGVDAKGAEELYLPSRLLWLDVEVLEDGALDKEGNRSLTSLHLPKTLTEIRPLAFDGCPSLSVLLYEGSEEAFSAIRCEADLSGLTVIFDTAYPPIPKREKKSKKRQKPTTDGTPSPETAGEDVGQ